MGIIIFQELDCRMTYNKSGYDQESEKRLEKLRKTLRQCCEKLPIQNLCGDAGKSFYEVACKKCKRRTGALSSRFQAAVVWNRGSCPDSSSRITYEIQSQDWGYEYVHFKNIKPLGEVV